MLPSLTDCFVFQLQYCKTSLISVLNKYNLMFKCDTMQQILQNIYQTCQFFSIKTTTRNNHLSLVNKHHYKSLEHSYCYFSFSVELSTDPFSTTVNTSFNSSFGSSTDVNTSFEGDNRAACSILQ